MYWQPNRQSRQSAKRILTAPWDFERGDIPLHVPFTDAIQQTFLRESVDITNEAEWSAARLGMSLHFAGPTGFHTSLDFPTAEEDSFQAEPDADSDGDSSLDDSEEGEQEEGHQAELLAIARSTVLVGGKGKATKVHPLRDDDNGLSNIVSVSCGLRVFCTSARVENAENFLINKRKPCKDCMLLWPDIITTLFDATQP